MKNSMAKCQIVGAGMFLLAVLLVSSVNTRADTVTSFFTGTIALDGDISDFFEADGVTLKPGVCLANDAAGLNEPPVALGAINYTPAIPSAFGPPSGFNQRRIISAYNPNVNGGTVFIGIDLPGGSGANSSSRTVHSLAGNANPNYFDGDVGAVGATHGRGKIVPFDADANGEADTIGRTAAGGLLFRCPAAAGDVVDVFDCASAFATGATDNPRTASGEALGARENYVATVQFGAGQIVAVEFVIDSGTAAGIARLNLTAMPANPLFGARVSSATGGDGAPLGFDVEFMITNVNAAVPNFCDRLVQTVVVDSGSNRDGAGQGEDQNILTCIYDLPASIVVTKRCPPTNGIPGGVLGFSGFVTNTGQLPLTNVTVFNNLPVPNTLVTNYALLNPGEFRFFSGTEPIPFDACAITNTVSVRATNICTGAVVTNFATTNCPLLISNRLTLTKLCASPVLTNSGNLTVTGLVCNLGNVAVTNVIVTDTQPGLPPSATTNLGTLNPGQCKPYSFTYFTMNCGTNTDVVNASGTNICGQRVDAPPATTNCFVCCPRIQVEKLVACLQAGATCPPALSADYQPTATGVKGNTGDPALDNPAFCYQIRVHIPSGSAPLTNIVVTDAVLGINRTFAGPFNPGTDVITPIIVTTNWPQTTTNTVLVSGQCAGPTGNGAVVTAQTNAIAFVIPLDIACAKLASLNGSPPARVVVDDNCFDLTNTVVWYAVVTNTGQADLTNITIMEVPSERLPCGPVALTLVGVLQPGQSSGLIPLCTNVFSCIDTSINNSIIVTATARADTNLCSNNRFGTNVVARNICDASVTICCEEVAQACRVTGGGRQDYPLVYPNSDVRYVTHGGQVGAPVGEQTCVVTTNFWLGNPCIHGRWTHVRHEKGGLRGNFHARFYDTLTCACLDTNLVAGFYGPGTTTNGLCNPGDRGRGPEPRPAPANKIVFTGVGDWADPNGRRAPRATLFRVDIEDRSEPGGSHPKGSRPPADRYRIRIWVLSTSELAQLNGAGPDPYLLSFRNAISACNGLTAPDGAVDGGGNRVSTANGTAVFGVRAPDIDDGGELERGNHQIHPMIKRCDPNNPTGPGLPKP